MKLKYFASVLFIFVAVNAHATITLYTDRTAWEAAAGGGTGDLFDDFSSGTKVNTNMFRTGYTISGIGLPAFPNGNANTTVDGSGYFRATIDNAGNFATFTFDSGIFALGYDLNPQDSDVGATVNFTLDGSTPGSYTLPGEDQTTFFGLIFDGSFTAFSIKGADGSAWHGIDNLEAYSAASVPEPSPLAMGVIGLAVACMTKRRRD